MVVERRAGGGHGYAGLVGAQRAHIQGKQPRVAHGVAVRAVLGQQGPHVLAAAEVGERRVERVVLAALLHLVPDDAALVGGVPAEVPVAWRSTVWNRERVVRSA